MTSKAPTAVAKAEKKRDSDDMKGIGVTAVNRALSILEAFTSASSSGELSLAELANHTGLYKSTILRLIESLEAFGFIRKNTEGLYTLGVAPLKFSAIYQAHVQPSELILSTLRALSKATTESASFYVINDKQRLCVYRVNSVRSIRDHVQVGQLLPLDKGAAGTVLRAFTGTGRVGDSLTAVRSAGFAVSMGERDPEIAAVAAPIFSNGNQLEGALCVSGPVSRFTDEKVEAIKSILLPLTTELTLALGGYEQSLCDTKAPQG